MKTRTEVKKHGNEWTFKVRDYDGNTLEEFRCVAKTKPEALKHFECYKAQHNMKLKKVS